MLLLTVEFNLDACTPQYRYVFGLLKTMLTYLLRRQVMSVGMRRQAIYTYRVSICPWSLDLPVPCCQPGAQ